MAQLSVKTRFLLGRIVSLVLSFVCRRHTDPADNIDYDDIKHYIKEHTTPGNGTSISIPGAGDARGKELEDSLFGILQQQHQRITLFVRSKAGEIERRLGKTVDCQQLYNN